MTTTPGVKKAKKAKGSKTSVASFADLAAALPFTADPSAQSSATATATTKEMKPSHKPNPMPRSGKSGLRALVAATQVLVAPAVADVRSISTENLLNPSATGEAEVQTEHDETAQGEAPLAETFEDTQDQDPSVSDYAEDLAADHKVAAVPESSNSNTVVYQPVSKGAQGTEIQRFMNAMTVQNTANAADTDGDADSDVDAAEALKAELMKALSVNPTSKAALLTELLEGSDVTALLQAYAVTYEKLGAADAAEYATRYIDNVTSSKFHKAASKAVALHTAQLVALAQKVERVLKIDVIINKLTADEFQAAATAAIQDANVLRAAVLDLGKALELNTVAPKQTIAPLPTLIGVLHHATARVDVINSVSARYREAMKAASDNAESLQKALAEKEHELAMLRREMAEMVDARHVVPSGLTKRPILVTDGRKRFLCRTDGKPRSAPVKLSKLEWRADANNALAFSTESAAATAMEKLVWASMGKKASSLDVEAVGSLKLRDVALSDVRYAQHGAIVAAF